MPKISKLMGGNASKEAKKIIGAFGAAKLALYILKLAFYCIFIQQFLLDGKKSAKKVKNGRFIFDKFHIKMHRF